MIVDADVDLVHDHWTAIVHIRVVMVAVVTGQDRDLGTVGCGRGTGG